MSTSSTNTPREILPFERQDADHSALRAVILELDLSIDLRKQRVVFPETDIQSRPEPPAALTHENRSAGHDIAVVALDAESLRVAVTAVP